VKTQFGSRKIPGAEAVGKVLLAIRPEHISLGGNIPAIVRDVVYQGSFKRIVALPAAQPDFEMLCKFPADTAVAVGDKVSLNIQSDRLVLLKD
jgi:spermidine/putrescine transport system ATP-binding protein